MNWSYQNSASSRFRLWPDSVKAGLGIFNKLPVVRRACDFDIDIYPVPETRRPISPWLAVVNEVDHGGRALTPRHSLAFRPWCQIKIGVSMEPEQQAELFFGRFWPLTPYICVT